MYLGNDCFYEIQMCPWGGCDVADSTHLYFDVYGSAIVRCDKCGCVYAKRRLNNHGLEVYWKKYSSRCHTASKDMVNKREKMYKLEFEYINSFINGSNSVPRVLDIGCGEGGFLDLFKKAGYDTVGVEYGEEAALIADQKHKIYRGEFTKLDIIDKYDLIVFRGVLQYLPNVKDYLNKAISILKAGGYIFITAQPNMDSMCITLFRENSPLAVTSSDFIGFNEKMLTNYFLEKNLLLIGSKFFYKESPYADEENDILRVAEAIRCTRNGEQINSTAPAWYDNMMSLVFH